MNPCTAFRASLLALPVPGVRVEMRTFLHRDPESLPGASPESFDALLERCRALGAYVKTARRGPGRFAGFRARAPRALLREGRNLLRLARLGVPAVEPLAFGWRRDRDGGEEAFLATRLEPEAVDLERLAGGRPDGERLPRPWLERLAEHVAVMHRARFVHRDLFLRNVLCSARDPRRLIFLDCRKGRLRRDPLAWFSPRGFLYDLACLQLDVLAHASPAAWDVFLERYRESLGLLWRGWVLRSIAARRRRLARALLAKPLERFRGRLQAYGRSPEELRERWGV